MKPDEQQLLRAVAAGETPLAAGERLGMHPRRLNAVCEKWDRKGWLVVGVSVRVGTLTAAGRAAAQQLGG